MKAAQHNSFYHSTTNFSQLAHILRCGHSLLEWHGIVIKKLYPDKVNARSPVNVAHSSQTSFTSYESPERIAVLATVEQRSRLKDASCSSISAPKTCAVTEPLGF
nr:hypothetical protein CFP56_21117 [Quercus suber]